MYAGKSHCENRAPAYVEAEPAPDAFKHFTFSERYAYSEGGGAFCRFSLSTPKVTGA